MIRLIITTLLYQLYPPLKGFSHSLDTYVCKPLPKDPSRGVANEFACERDVLIKIVDLKGIPYL